MHLSPNKKHKSKTKRYNYKLRKGENCKNNMQNLCDEYEGKFHMNLNPAPKRT